MTSLRWSANILGGGIGTAILLSFLTTCAKQRGVNPAYYAKNKSLVENEKYWDFIMGAMKFDVRVKVSTAAYTFTAIVLVALSVSFIIFIWSVGFWAVLRLLIGISGRLAKLLGVEAAVVPIASMILTIIGMVLAVV